MAKMITPDLIPAEMQAVAFWTTSHGETMWQLSKSVRGAKSISSRHKNSSSFGWAVIEDTDRVHGKMIW